MDNISRLKEARSHLGFIIEQLDGFGTNHYIQLILQGDPTERQHVHKMPTITGSYFIFFKTPLKVL